MYWFTSDEHYGHTNVLDYCQRPFRDVCEMDGEMIKRHNAVVKKDDTTIHAGDFTLKKNADSYINLLNGQHVFLKGSHDYWQKDVHPYIFEKKIDGIYVVVCHYAMRVWPRSHYGSIQLYGHSHGHLSPLKRQYDITVDNNDFYPISLKTIIKKLKL